MNRKRARMTDADTDELIQEVQNKQRHNLTDAPELRMTYDIRHAYQDEANEDARSLERVLAKLQGEQRKSPSKVLFLPHLAHHHERTTTMQQNIEKTATMQNSIETLTQGKTSRGWQYRVGLLVAMLFLTLLIGGLLTVLSNHSSPSTAQSTVSASNVITSATLSDNANQTSQAPAMQHFTVGQTVWLTSAINLGKTGGSGTLMVKWYENGHLEATSLRHVSAPKGQAVAMVTKIISVRSHQVYTKSGVGKVEIYWNGQLVTTLNLVVQ